MSRARLWVPIFLFDHSGNSQICYTSAKVIVYVKHIYKTGELKGNKNKKGNMKNGKELGGKLYTINLYLLVVGDTIGDPLFSF